MRKFGFFLALAALAAALFAPFRQAQGESAAISARAVTPVRFYDAQTGEAYFVDLESYVAHVVAAEMPATWGDAALMAQAVAARSYTLYKMAHGGCVSHPEADVCSQSGCCQAYCGDAVAVWGQENASRVERAVESTRGQVLTYDGAVAQALYHASSHGTTEDAAAVFGQAVPYLVRVSTPEQGQAASFVFTRAELCALFGAAGDGVTIEKTPAGRVAALTFGGVVLSGVQVRKELGLPSTSFTLSQAGEHFTFTCYGYGHGLGMSQQGAQVFAQQGFTYTDILAHYYPGTQIEAVLPGGGSF